MVGTNPCPCLWSGRPEKCWWGSGSLEEVYYHSDWFVRSSLEMLMTALCVGYSVNEQLLSTPDLVVTETNVTLVQL